MIFDSLILAAVCDELSRTIVNGKIERVTQPTPLEIVLRVYAGAGKQDLYFSCEPASARIHLTSIRRENPPRPYAFCMLLRKHLDGGRITAVTRPMGFLERVVAFECRSYESERFVLIAEIMGRHSNLILVNSTGTILGAAKHITSDINRYREVIPGIKYLNPPRQREKQDPLVPFQDDSGQEFTQEEAAKWLLATFAGVSPLLSREVALRADTPLTPTTLWQCLSGLLRDAEEGRFSPVIWSDERSVTQGVYAIPLMSVPPDRQFPRPSINAALDSAASSIETRDAYDRSKNALVVALQRSIRQKVREVEEVKAGLENAERADEYQQTGELIQTNIQAIPRGATEATFDDYYNQTEDGATVQRTVALDPTMGPRENAARYFKKARKARESIANLEARLERVEAEIISLRLAEHDVQNATKREQIEEIHTRVSTLLIGKQPLDDAGDDQESPAARFEGHRIKTFRSLDGWDILVGENATSNDFLTTKVALPNDIWLHVRAATSAHGVIRSQNRPGSVSPAAITFAAELVAARSEVKHSSLIPVDYTLKKHVRKPRKSAPGAVTYQNEKTVYVAGING